MKSKQSTVEAEGIAKKNGDILTQINLLTEELRAKTTEVRQSEAGKWRMLFQLHEAQENLEQTLVENGHLEKSHQGLEKRIKKLLAAYPEYWEYDSLKVKYEAGSNYADWYITNTYLENRFIPKLVFRTRQENGITSIIFPPLTADESFPFLKKPYHIENDDQVILSPQSGSLLHGNNAFITCLSTTDWLSIATLTKNLTHQLQGPTLQLELPELNCQNLAKDISGLATTLSKWPQVLRYDNIEIQSTRDEGSYHSILIHMTNVSLGDYIWEELSYTLSTVAEDSIFEKHPRIEFSEKARNSILNWYAESNDHRGARLELRFAAPYQMDTYVWRTLAEKDQYLVVALVSSLSLQLTELQQVTTSVRRWHEWHRVANSIKQILAFQAKNNNLITSNLQTS